MNTIKKVFLKTLPVLAGYIVLGIGFGILMQKNGYAIWWVLAMSILIYAGSMQYVGVDLLTGQATLLATALTTLMVNARHLFYGISMVERYKGAGAKKPYMIFALTDETYSLVCTGETPEGINPHRYMFWVSLLNQSYWVTGSVIGYFLGMVIPFDMTGIEFSMTALFVTVFVQQWMDTKNHLPALTGLAATIVCLIIFGSSNFLIPSMIVITIILTVGKKYMEQENKE